MRATWTTPSLKRGPAPRIVARLRTWAFALAVGTWSAMAAQTAAAPGADAQPPVAAGRPFLATVFGEHRSPDFDLLVLRDGRRVEGRLVNDQIALRTSYGRLALGLEPIAGVQFAGPADAVTVVQCVNNDRFSGVLEPVMLELRLADGRAFAIRSEAVGRLIRRGVAGEADALAQHQFVVLKNGDRFAARLATERPSVTTGGTNRLLTLEALDVIRFSSDHPAAAQVELRDGTSFVADWAAEDLALTLAVGPSLPVYRDWIGAVFCQLGFRPPEYRIPTGDGAASARALPGLVWIEPGRFVMGSPAEEPGRDYDEAPLTEVTLTHGFWIGAREVTQAEYKAVKGVNPAQFIEDPALPVERVNWREAVEYCELLTRRWAEEARLPEGYAFRLPTEAEWEYACRAGATTRFSHGDDPEARRLGEFAWYGENSDSMSHPVGGRRPNAWGLHDLHGNVLEWCLDSATTYPGGSVTNYLSGAGRSPLRVARSGSWLYGANAARSANRDSYAETTRCSDLGFRVVLAPALPGTP